VASSGRTRGPAEAVKHLEAARYLLAYGLDAHSQAVLSFNSRK
jgi:hypothetical protein